MAHPLFDNDKHKKPRGADGYGYEWWPSSVSNAGPDDGMWVKHPKCPECGTLISQKEYCDIWECFGDEQECNLTDYKMDMRCPADDCGCEMWLCFDFLWTEKKEW